MNIKTKLRQILTCTSSYANIPEKFLVSCCLPAYAAMSDTERPVDVGGPSEERQDRGADGDGTAVSEREAYFQALRLWIQQAQIYQNLSTCFPYYMMTFQGVQNNPTNVPLLNNNYQFHGQQFPFQVPNPARNDNQAPNEGLSPTEGMLHKLCIVYVVFC